MVTRVIGVRIDGTQARRGAVQVRRALRDIERQGRRTGGALKSVGNAIFSLKGAFATLGGALVARSLVDTATNLERVERGLKQATGSAESGAQAMGFLSEQAERLGLDLKGAEDGFVGIAAAARGTTLEGEEAKNIFLGVAEASAALGLSADQTKGALTAIEQIISKGKVSAEELRGQLGERLPGAFQIAARAAGVTTTELDKMLVQGKLLATDFLPLLARQLRLEMGGAAEEAADSLQGALNRMGNAVENLKRAIVRSGALDPLQEAIISLTGLINDPAFQDGAASAMKAIGDGMAFVVKNADLLLIALQAIAAAVGGSFFVKLAAGAVQFGVGMSGAAVAATRAALATTGLARATAGATAGMAALRGVGLALGGPIGILVGVATAAVLLASKFKSAKEETADLREELEDLGATPLQLETGRIQAQIARVEDALNEARDRQEKAQARFEKGPGKPSSGGFLGASTQEILFTGSSAAAQAAADDIAFFEEKLKLLEEALANVGTAAGDNGLAAELEALREKMKLAMGAGSETDEAAKVIKNAKDSLEGLQEQLELSTDTFGMSEAAILKYRLTQGDLKDDVAALGEEGILLRDRLISLQETYDRLESSADQAKFVQEAFADVYGETRTAAEAYADEVERLDALQILLANSGNLTAEQIARLPEIFDRAKEAAADLRDSSTDDFDAMTEFATQAARAMQGAFADLFFNVMQGEFSDLEKNFKSTIDRMMANFLASQLLNVFAGFAGQGGFLGALGTVVAGGKAEGGSARAGEAVLVGERGPEIFTPGENGRIIPNRTVGRIAAIDAMQSPLGSGTDQVRTEISRGMGGLNANQSQRGLQFGSGDRFPARAQGGPVMRGQPVVAGEAGPELFVGGSGGGGGGSTVIMNITTPNVESFRQSQGQLLNDMGRLMQGARQRNG